MSRAAAALLVAAAIPAACARIQYFLTSSAQPYGLTDPALAFDPTLDTQTDSYYYAVSAFPPPVDPPPEPVIDPSAGDFACVWLRF